MFALLLFSLCLILALALTYLEKAKVKYYFKQTKYLQKKVFLNLTIQEIEKIRMRTYYNLSTTCDIHIFEDFFVIIRHKAFPFGTFYIPNIITHKDKNLTNFKNFPIFNITNLSNPNVNEVNLTLINIKANRHSKELTIRNLPVEAIVAFAKRKSL